MYTSAPEPEAIRTCSHFGSYFKIILKKFKGVFYASINLQRVSFITLLIAHDNGI